MRAARLTEAMLTFEREGERITRARGLSLQRYALLLMIRTARDGSRRASLAELGERLARAQSTVVELVNRAEDAVLVRRELARRPRRGVVVALTPAGEDQVSAVAAELVSHRRRLARSLASPRVTARSLGGKRRAGGPGTG